MRITRIKVEGLRHVTDVLINKIPAKARGNVVSGALRRAFKPMVLDAKVGAAQSKHKSSGALAQSIRIWRVSRRRRGNPKKTFMRMEIGPKRSDKRALGRYYSFYGVKEVTASRLVNGIRHGHLIEYGAPGRNVKKRPFLRPAFARHGRGSIERFRKELKVAIEREARRLGRKQVVAGSSEGTITIRPINTRPFRG
jgi:hypothetical protein